MFIAVLSGIVGGAALPAGEEGSHKAGQNSVAASSTLQSGTQTIPTTIPCHPQTIGPHHLNDSLTQSSDSQAGQKAFLFYQVLPLAQYSWEEDE